MPQDIEHYFSIREKGSLEIPKIKGSRFIGLAFPVETQSEVKKALSVAKIEYPNASHYCFAYRFHGKELVQHQSDDGEPSGTAGAPILRQMESLDLRNALVVVIRYFGGTKLGKSGLIKSYGLAAKELLARVQLSKKLIRTYVRIQFPYTDTKKIMGVIAKNDIDIVEQVFEQETSLTLALPLSKKTAFIQLMNDSLSGKLNLVDLDNVNDGDLSI